MKVLDLGRQLLVDLHHRLDLHLGLNLHALYHHLQLGFPLLSLPNPLLISLGFPLTLHVFLFELNLSIGSLI